MTDEGDKGKREKNEQKDRVVNPGKKKFPVRRRITVFGSRLRKESKILRKCGEMKRETNYKILIPWADLNLQTVVYYFMYVYLSRALRRYTMWYVQMSKFDTVFFQCKNRVLNVWI
jgi:hypothetical protein